MVGDEKVDPPIEVVGIRPDVPPVPYWGWGTIPDQYGRRWADDDGQSPRPRRPSRSHPMLLHAWPAQDQIPALDMSELRSAISAADAARFLGAVLGHDVDDALQHVGDRRTDGTEAAAGTGRTGGGGGHQPADLARWSG